LEKNHDAIFLGAGLGTPSRLNIPGENLSGVYDALEFIRRVTRRDWPAVDVGRRVAVIGGGNTAIDAVTEARRLGAERVMILYRRGREEMPAYDFEYELAKHDEVEFRFQVTPVRFVGTDHVEAIACIPMRLGAPDEKGRRRPEPADGPEFQIAVDMVIESLGQHLEETFLGNIPDLRIERDRLWVDPDTLQTTNPKYFAGGDIINGGKEVVNAAADGKRAAHGIDRWLFPEKYSE
jgi:glutamate synthase (NADPH/NADH) small chain